MTWLTYVPGYSRQEFGPGVAFKQRVCKLVVHTTEGNSYPNYNGNQPNLTINPWNKTFRQHLPLTIGGRALKVGSVSTNSMGCIQVEIIGTCDRGAASRGVKPVWEMGEDELEYIAMVFKAISRATEIPLTTGVTWVSYPASYGDTRIRLSAGQWIAYEGVLGHQHVPGNSHGDPGILNIGRILYLANGGQPVTAPLPVVVEEEDDMQDLIEALYIERVGRIPSEKELYDWDIVTAAQGLNRKQTYEAFLRSPAENSSIIKAYQDKLGRIPDEPEIALWRGKSLKEVWDGVSNSAEAASRR